MEDEETLSEEDEEDDEEALKTRRALSSIREYWSSRRSEEILEESEENRRLTQGAEKGRLKKLEGIEQTTKFLESSNPPSFRRRKGCWERRNRRRKRRREEKLKVIQQATPSLECKETVRKYNRSTVKEKAAVDLTGNEPTHSDPPYLKERNLMLTTPGLKFQPTDKEAILHLQKKHSNPCQTLSWSPIKDCTNLYGTQPGHLPDANSIKEKEALYYYVPTKKKSGNGDRIGPNGYWRATGNKNILSETGSEIGYRRTLKYFEYPDENQKYSRFGKSTNWMMHEYRLATTTSSQSQEESFEHWTICKITWTGKNIKVTNYFSGEGSIGPSEEIVDSKREEIAQTNHHSIGDELQQFERWSQEKRGELREQRMNKIYQSEEITPCYASGIHPTPSIMATTHEVETGVEPRQLENPGRITEEFEPSFPEQTCASSWHRSNNSEFTGTEAGIQSRDPFCPELNPSMPDLTSPIWTPDPSSYPDFTEREDGIQPWNYSWPEPNFSITR